MMTVWSHDGVLDHLQVGLSAITWCPEDMARSEWLFVNDTRCEMTGYARQELLDRPPIIVTTRESIAQSEEIVARVNTDGRYSCESTLRHKSQRAIPVRMHMTLLRREEGAYLLVEHHDITSFKETEASLKRAQQSSYDMLSLIEREKHLLSRNIVDNLGLVAFPLINQLRITATGPQNGLLDLLEDRIRRVTQELGIKRRFSLSGAILSRRQILICEMIRSGMTSKEIALVLECAPSTINNHRNIIRKKLGLSGKSDRLQAYLNTSR